jgi:hypothetical protein
MYGTKIYYVWSNMKVRCLNPTSPNYKNYGGRGITVCDRWIKKFSNFLEDMGDSYKEGLDLDRVDNSLGYSPENCRWATRKQNNNNKRVTRFFDFYGEKLCTTEIAERLGVSTKSVYYHLAENKRTVEEMQERIRT